MNFSMNFSTIKAVLDLGVIGTATALMFAYGSVQPVLGGPAEVETRAEVMAAERQSWVAAYEAGTLLQGSGPDVYYVTETGKLRRIYDRQTLTNFGFEDREIIRIDDVALTAMPQAGDLTRLVFDDEDNLYWVAQGQRWLFNEWKPVVNQATYNDVPASHLDGSLAEALPIGLKSNIFLRETPLVPKPDAKRPLVPKLEFGNEVYYFAHQSITPVAAGSYDEAEVIEVPAGVLAVYPQKTSLTTLQTWLNAETQAANVRTGPGLEFTVMDVIDNTGTIIVKGRTADNNWLQIRYQGKNGWSTGWLSASLVHRRGLLPLLPLANTEPPDAAQPTTATVAAESSISVPETPQPLNCGTEPIRGFGTVWDKHPETHPLLGCPFTNFRRDEHATRAAVQTFEHGWMLWLETDTVANVDPIYVFFEADGSYIRYGDQPLTDAHKYAPTPAGFYKVGDRFAKIYWEAIGPEGRARLGYATNEATDSLGAFQEFQNGRMFWAGQADTIYVIYQGDYDFDGDGQTTWLRGWTSFEDTFEEAVEE